ncbi:MAG: hypothetical protein MZV64_20055 [Ignavibacteriales bacterium]|nr:hypothetical protein [Ignavibacteriales bacterium]
MGNCKTALRILTFTTFASFGKIYGAYALVVVVAFWIFYASIVFIIGAEIGKALFRKKSDA